MSLLSHFTGTIKNTAYSKFMKCRDTAMPKECQLKPESPPSSPAHPLVRQGMNSLSNS